jgi:DNA-directed RNA polymerase specialized sigma24 family protein
VTAAPQPPSTGHRDTARTAELEIERDYAQLEAEVIGTARAKLAQTGGTVDEQALAAAYNQAWHALYAARVDGDEIANRVGFLVQVTYRRALDERRAASRRAATDPAALDIGVDPDLDGQIDDALRVRALMQGMRERLDERELRAATLCYLHGYTRPEAATALGVRPRRFEKVMDRVSREMSGLVGDLRAGEWCDSRRSLIGAYALGVLDVDGERYRLATDHLEDCAACRRRVLCMRGLAGIVPPVAVLVPGAAGGVAGGGASAALADRLGWLGRFDGHGLEIAAAGGAAVAAATGAFVVAGSPGLGSDRDATPVAAPPPLRPSASDPLRAVAAGGARQARAAMARRRVPGERRAPERAAAPSAAALPEPARVPEQVAPSVPVAPQELVPAPATPPAPAPAAPADDGWEEFELRR